MSLPGPSGISWALLLLLFGALALPVGEAVRRFAGRWSALARSPEIVEQLLLDFFLGGMVLYLLAEIPLGIFGLDLAILTVGVASGALLMLEWRRWRLSSWRKLLDSAGLRASGASLAVLGLFLLLFGVEVGVAESIPTGNTFDSSLLTTYTTLLLLHGTLPISLSPIAAQGLPYPQGTSVWLGTAQLVFALPPARLGLLVTPLFLALPPVAGYVLGRRLWGTTTGGLAAALMFGLLSSWTRVLVAGSNDFVFAFPLVLLLVAWTPRWSASSPPPLGDALLYGALAGYSAALNPVGAELLFPLLLLLGLVSNPRFGGAFKRWASRWTMALSASLVFVLPSVSALYVGRNNPGWTAGAVLNPGHLGPGISFPQFVGLTDPFLFGPNDVWLSPIPLLRFELLVMIVLGAAFLLRILPEIDPHPSEVALRPLLAIGILLPLVALAGFVLLRGGLGFLLPLAYLSSAAEFSILLFAFLALLATFPLVRVLEEAGALFPRATRRAPPDGTGAAADPPGVRLPRRPFVAFSLVIIVVASGMGATVAELPTILSEQYAPFGNVSAGDFALLEWAGDHLPATARVLVAPGSAGQFLPGYLPTVRLLFPMGPVGGNLTYRSLVDLLDNGTIGASGNRSLSILNVEYIVVTQANNRLYPAFVAAPFLMDGSTYPVLFHQGDAYLFARV